MNNFTEYWVHMTIQLRKLTKWIDVRLIYVWKIMIIIFDIHTIWVAYFSPYFTFLTHYRIIFCFDILSWFSSIMTQARSIIWNWIGDIYYNRFYRTILNICDLSMTWIKDINKKGSRFSGHIHYSYSCNEKSSNLSLSCKHQLVL